MRPTLIPSLLLVILTALAFWPARNAPFIKYDDPVHVTENPYILPPTATRLAYFWRYPFDRSPVPGIASTAGQQLAPYQEIYSPLAFTVWGLLVYPARVAPLAKADAPLASSAQQGANQQDFSLDPAVYHSFNLVLHVVNVLLVFALLRQFVKQEWAAALGTALFALHPVQVESVAWVTGMNNLLSGLFALCALLLYLNYKDQSEKPRWNRGTYWGSTLCFLLSVLSKPSSVTLPILALLLCWGLGEKKWRARLLEMIPWGAVALFCIVTNSLVQRDVHYSLKPMTWQKPFLIGDAFTFYGAKLFFPWHLAPDYGRRPEWVMEQPLTYFIWLVPVGVLLIAWMWWRGSEKRREGNREESSERGDLARITLMGLAFFAMVLLPSSGIVTYYFHLISTVSDRYMYMALIGPAIVVSVLASRCLDGENASPRLWLTGGGVAAVAALIFLSFQQTKLWQDDMKLWPHNIVVNPLSTVAYYLYGTGLYRQKEYQLSIPVLEKGIRVAPDKWGNEVALGDSYFALKDYGKSELHYRRALAIWPTAVDAHFGLGLALTAQRRMPEAIEQFRQGLATQPQNRFLLGYLGINLTKIGHGEEGANFLRQALDQGFDPSTGHLYLGNALAISGKLKEAMNEWYTVVQHDPNNVEALFNIGLAVAKLGNTALGIRVFTNALQVKPDYVPAQIQLGLLWQKQGQTEKAKAAFQAALRIDPHNALARESLNAIR